MSVSVRKRILGDAISLRLNRRAAEARKLMRTIQSAKPRSSVARKAEKRMEVISLDAELLWNVRRKMLEITYST